MSTTPTLDGTFPSTREPPAGAQLSPSILSAILADRLIPWYRSNGRRLPWRDRADDPYAVWVSEIMLQQTQVATAVPHYVAWMERFPCLEALASATETEVLHAWQGLGYYGRARRMHEAAQALMDRHAGVIPSDREALRALPGVGPYTASAIRALAFNLPDAAIDVNVERVLGRLLGVPSSTPKAQSIGALKGVFDSALHGVSPREAVQAVMELGALVCSARSPACCSCPIAQVCAACRSGEPESFGPRRPVLEKEAQTHVAVVVVHHGRWLVEKRPDSGRLAGLWQFPTRELRADETEHDCARRAALEAAGVTIEPNGLTTSIRHTVTRFAVTLRAHAARLVSENRSPDMGGRCRWVDAGEVASLPMPSSQARVRATLLAHTTREQCP